MTMTPRTSSTISSTPAAASAAESTLGGPYLPAGPCLYCARWHAAAARHCAAYPARLHRSIPLPIWRGGAWTCGAFAWRRAADAPIRAVVRREHPELPE